VSESINQVTEMVSVNQRFVEAAEKLRKAEADNAMLTSLMRDAGVVVPD
jgi:hypothetical protein